MATSNVPPSDLYKNGLNRQLFLPFIDLIQQHMDVEELQAAKDFRLEKLSGKPLYFTPADAKAKAEMDRLWNELTGQHPGAPVELDVKGRSCVCRRRRWAWRGSRSPSCASSRSARSTICTSRDAFIPC